MRVLAILHYVYGMAACMEGAILYASVVFIVGIGYALLHEGQ
jgi:hypothetical protein